MAVGSSTCSPNLDSILNILHSVWGYAELRPAQRKAILAVLRGRDCLAIMPTGGGKSLCYQVPALLLSGLTLVVSPLISLMQDQVAALRRRRVAAAYLSSTQKPALQSAVLEAVGAGQVRLLYVAPERLSSIVPLVARRGVSLFAVDEAHCISEWGHDFRPHYRTLRAHRAALGWPPTIALTATATPVTQADIGTVLALRRPATVLTSFDRPNLWLSARRASSEPERLAILLQCLSSLKRGSAIVYVPTRNRADGVAQALRWRGHPAAPYHAGLPAPARRALLRRFTDGTIRVMVATNAFGMGIDKPDVRLVVHLGIPARPEAYYQEAGRAGRDGEPAHCELVWRDADWSLARQLALRSLEGSRVESPHQAAAERGLETMKRYVSTRRCRRAVLLQYLGERVVRCGGCDRCK